MIDLAESVVVLTGASGNLGKAAARAFIDSGATLALVERDEARLKSSYSSLGVDRPHLLIGDIDLTSESDVNSAVDKILSNLGKIDVLINTVGGYRAGKPVEETDPATWDFMLDLNARTVFLMSRAVIPQMKHQKSGAIVNVSTLAAKAGKAKMAAYIASKSAVIRLTESMSEELRPYHINVNVILPNSIDTPENRADSPGADFSKWVSPEAIAEVMVFLASPAGRAVHGASIPVRGPA